jgi:crotonobetainyl-CoA:carnitine CoA-transferase CaiB-like acyl-CoA transferase
MPYVTDLMDELFATRTLAEWGVLFDSAGLTWGPAATMSEVAADPHSAAVGTFPEIEHPTAGTFRTVAAPMRLRGQDISPRGPAPELGQHTREVLTAIGVTPAELDALLADGTIAE